MFFFVASKFSQTGLGNNFKRRVKNNDTGQKSGGRGRVFGEASEDFNMPLIYAFVARGTTVLAEHTGHSGNFATVAAEVRRVNSALLPPFCDV
jgi:hypothetical protein